MQDGTDKASQDQYADSPADDQANPARLTGEGWNIRRGGWVVWFRDVWSAADHR